jgi:hypothetical protein
VIRKRDGRLQVQVFAGRDPLTGRKRWLGRQVRGQTKTAYREAKKVEASCWSSWTGARSTALVAGFHARPQPPRRWAAGWREDLPRGRSGSAGIALARVTAA